MIEKIDINSSSYIIDDSLKKYVKQRIGKLDRYLPRNYKKDVIIKVTISQIGKGGKYEVVITMEIPGGKVITAKDVCTNVLAGIDVVEARLAGQIRRYKLDAEPHLKKHSLKNLFIKRK